MTRPTRRRGVANTPYIEAMRQLRRSSAASPHDPRPRRQRTRAGARASAIRNGW